MQSQELLSAREAVPSSHSSRHSHRCLPAVQLLMCVNHAGIVTGCRFFCLLQDLLLSVSWVSCYCALGTHKHSAAQAVLQGPRQNFRLPVADFKQAVLDAHNGVESSGTGLKIRLPAGKGLTGQAGKPKGRPPGSRNKPPGRSRSAEILCRFHGK